MRDHRVEELEVGRRARIAGRILDVEGPDGTVGEGEALWWVATLRDASGDVRCAGRGSSPMPGDIISLAGVLGGDGFEAQSMELLLRPHRSPLDDPEWRRLSNPEHSARLWGRAGLIAAIRDWFRGRGFLEVETGQLVDEPGQEPTLDPFVLRGGRSLITSPELRMKRLLCAGFEQIFELSHAFRDGLGERSSLHHPEFTMLEWYRAFSDEHRLIRDLEELLPALAACAPDRLAHVSPGFRWEAPFEQISVKAAFERYASVDLEPFLDGDHEGFRESARRAGVRAVADAEEPETLFFRIFLDRIEPKLGIARPTVVHGYPATMAALARVDESDPRIARRFELYVGGVELANAFLELNDAAEQVRRFDQDRAKKRADGRDPGPRPTRFLRALEGGMPPSAGIALGVDRLVMLLLGVRRIDDVLAFPDPPSDLSADPD